MPAKSGGSGGKSASAARGGIGGNGGIGAKGASAGEGGDMGGTIVGGCAIADVPAAASIPEIKINLRT